MKRFTVFSGTQMALRKMDFLPRLNPLVKASCMCCSPYPHSVSSCLLCITVSQLRSCKGKLYQHRPPFKLCLRADHAIHAETDLCKLSRAHWHMPNTMIMRTNSSPGNSLPTLRRDGRVFRKPCLIGSAPGKASPCVYLLNAELQRETMGCKTQWYPSIFPWSQFMPGQAYYLWLQTADCRPSCVTLCHGSQDFGDSYLLCHSMAQTEPAGVQPQPA